MAKNVMQKEFSVPVRWLENQSYNTYQNAKFSTEILKNHNIKHVFLVTNAWHMRRAIWAFKQFNIQAIAAPIVQQPLNQYQILPSLSALHYSRIAIHEYLGILWYKIHYS